MLVDQQDRDLIATALDETMVVEAAAGTGKTTELVKRIVRILATGRASVGEIVAVTFTEKAAGELKLRLREALERERSAVEGETRGRLDAALSGLEEAHVSTIHGFCADLLRERPVEAGIDPLFAVLTEAQAARLFEEAFGAWIQEQLGDPDDGVRRALRRTPMAFGAAAGRPDGPVDRLRGAAWELAQWRDFDAAWTRRPFDRKRAIEAAAGELQAFAALTSSPGYARDPLYVDTAPARRVAAEIALQQSAGHEDADGWEARLVDLSRDRTFTRARTGRGVSFGGGVSRQSVLESLGRLKAALDTFRMDADADLAALLQQELGGAIARYETMKARAGALDFLDLLLKARDLVRDNASVRRGFQQRFRRLFVDEFQDTDPLQAEILLLLAAEDPAVTDWRVARPSPGRLFIVGDPKQSIYRFRRADVGIYREVCERLEAAGARRVTLRTSFRSLPRIQACVNAAFERVMTGDAFTLQAPYVPLSPFRDDRPDRPAVVALPVPEPYGTRNLSAVAIERSLPDAVGAFVDWLLTRSGWTVTERAGDAPVPVSARHVCILFRRFLSYGEDATQPYVRALEARGVRHVLVGGKTFHDREEVETIRAALSAIEWPDDELAVFATLRGALFAIGDEELLEWKLGLKHRLHPFRIPQEFRDPAGCPPERRHLLPVAGALRVLQRLHRRRNYIPVAETLHALLEETRAHVAFVLRPSGEQALANVLHVAELARQYEADGGISFRGFVEELRRASEGAQAAEAPILEEGSDGVRLMTVHKAKGLEFPVVVLADLTCRLSRPEAGRWIDPGSSLCAIKLGGWSPIDLLLHDAEEAARDRAEAERLAYVAATRARDLLVVPAVGDDVYEGWLDPLMPAIYPPEPVRRQPEPAPGCPAFTSKDTVLNRPDGDPARPATVAPGMYRFQSGSPGRPGEAYEVVWWSPQDLQLGAQPAFGLRRDDLIVKDGDGAAVEAGLTAHRAWLAERHALVERAGVPSVVSQTSTAWAAEAAVLGIDQVIADAAEIEIVEIAGASGRPRGARFGTLVHAVLATVPLDAPDGIVRRASQTQARILIATAEEVAAAAVAVSAVLRHPLMDRVRSGSSIQRESPVTWLHRNGTLVEGVLDLAFVEDGTTVVVDFKTDHELSAGESRYRAQLQQYVTAVAAATGQPARGVLFRV